VVNPPFDYPGGKRDVAEEVWRRFGDVQCYVEPFVGSAAVLLARPRSLLTRPFELVNDLDGMLVNFWRSISKEPEAVLKYADWPCSEIDLRARSRWMIENTPAMEALLIKDPEHYNVQAAGYWIWGRLASIAKFPDESLVRSVEDRFPTDLPDRIRQTATRMRDVVAMCGDYKRLLTHGIIKPEKYLTGVFLDPPYFHDARNYTVTSTVADESRQWAIDHGSHPNLRIAYCGYANLHSFPEDWQVYRWTRTRTRNFNDKERFQECVWFSPSCHVPHALPGMDGLHTLEIHEESLAYLQRRRKNSRLATKS